MTEMTVKHSIRLRDERLERREERGSDEMAKVEATSKKGESYGRRKSSIYIHLRGSKF
jgi:hypothetical protein